MIQTTDRERVKLFLDVTKKEYGEDAVTYCEEQIGVRTEFNPAGLWWQWRCWSCRDQIQALAEQATVATNSQIRICIEDGMDTAVSQQHDQ